MDGHGEHFRPPALVSHPGALMASTPAPMPAPGLFFSPEVPPGTASTPVHGTGDVDAQAARALALSMAASNPVFAGLPVEQRISIMLPFAQNTLRQQTAAAVVQAPRPPSAPAAFGLAPPRPPAAPLSYAAAVLAPRPPVAPVAFPGTVAPRPPVPQQQQQQPQLQQGQGQTAGSGAWPKSLEAWCTRAFDLIRLLPAAEHEAIRSQIFTLVNTATKEGTLWLRAWDREPQLPLLVQKLQQAGKGGALKAHELPPAATAAAMPAPVPVPAPAPAPPSLPSFSMPPQPYQAPQLQHQQYGGWAPQPSSASSAVSGAVPGSYVGALTGHKRDRDTMGGWGAAAVPVSTGPTPLTAASTAGGWGSGASVQPTTVSSSSMSTSSSTGGWGNMNAVHVYNYTGMDAAAASGGATASTGPSYISLSSRGASGSNKRPRLGGMASGADAGGSGLASTGSNNIPLGTKRTWSAGADGAGSDSDGSDTDAAATSASAAAAARSGKGGSKKLSKAEQKAAAKAAKAEAAAAAKAKKGGKTGRGMSMGADGDEEPLDRRKARFGPVSVSGGAGSSSGGGGIGSWMVVNSGADIISTDSGEIDFEAMTVVGTSTALEKSYLRLIGPPDPSTVRPEHILHKSLALLKSKQAAGAPYTYLSDQLRSMRQDLTLQHIKNSFTAEVYETNARVALDAADWPQFNQCQTQLWMLYDHDGVASPARLEFLAYKLLYTVHAAEESNARGVLSSMTASERAHAWVRHAIQAVAAAGSDNWQRYFMLQRSAPNLGGKLMSAPAHKARIRMLQAYTKAVRPILPLRFLQLQLGLQSMDAARSFCEACGGVVKPQEVSPAQLEAEAERWAAVLTPAQLSAAGSVHTGAPSPATGMVRELVLDCKASAIEMVREATAHELELHKKGLLNTLGSAATVVVGAH